MSHTQVVSEAHTEGTRWAARLRLRCRHHGRRATPERAVEIGLRVKERFTAMQRRFPQIGDVRGLGAMVGMELVADPVTKEPATALTKAYRAKLFENGLINIMAGTYDNVIRT